LGRLALRQLRQRDETRAAKLRRRTYATFGIDKQVILDRCCRPTSVKFAEQLIFTSRFQISIVFELSVQHTLKLRRVRRNRQPRGQLGLKVCDTVGGLSEKNMTIVSSSTPSPFSASRIWSPF